MCIHTHTHTHTYYNFHDWFCFVFLILYFWECNLYSRFLTFAFCICDQFCTFKNLIFSIHFCLGVWLLDWLHSPLLTLPFLPQFTSNSSPSSFSSLLNSVNLSGCSSLWRTLRQLITGKIHLSPSDSHSCPPGHQCFPPPSSLLCVILWTSLSVPHCGESFHH